MTKKKEIVESFLPIQQIILLYPALLRLCGFAESLFGYFIAIKISTLSCLQHCRETFLFNTVLVQLSIKSVECGHGAKGQWYYNNFIH